MKNSKTKIILFLQVLLIVGCNSIPNDPKNEIFNENLRMSIADKQQQLYDITKTEYNVYKRYFTGNADTVAPKVFKLIQKHDLMLKNSMTLKDITSLLKTESTRLQLASLAYDQLIQKYDNRIVINCLKLDTTSINDKTYLFYTHLNCDSVLKITESNVTVRYDTGYFNQPYYLSSEVDEDSIYFSYEMGNLKTNQTYILNNE